MLFQLVYVAYWRSCVTSYWRRLVRAVKANIANTISIGEGKHNTNIIVSTLLYHYLLGSLLT